MPVKTNVKISTLGYVIVYVKDTKTAVPFYQDTLGMAVKSNEDGWVEFETGGTTFALHADESHKSGSTKTEGHGQPLPVFNVDDFYGVYESLKASGVHFAQEPKQVCEAGPGQVGMSAEFHDLDGNALSIWGIVKK